MDMTSFPTTIRTMLVAGTCGTMFVLTHCWENLRFARFWIKLLGTATVMAIPV